MLHLRIVVPTERTNAALSALLEEPGVTGVARLTGAGIDPAGDLLLADVTRESAERVIARLRELRVHEDGTITVDELDLTLSRSAVRAEAAAPGNPSDAVVWAMVERKAADSTRLTWSFFVFLVLGTAIAAVAVILDSEVLVIGAMVVSPDFTPVGAACIGLARGRGRLLLGALRLLVLGFAVAIAAVTLFAAVLRLAGWIGPDALAADRPFTAFIYSPDKWSFLVALLAGAAGTLALTAERSDALVGVFISVTTVPAAGNAAVALAVGDIAELAGSLAQIAVNVAGMLIAGTVVLLAQRALGPVPTRPRQPVVVPSRRRG